MLIINKNKLMLEIGGDSKCGYHCIWRRWSQVLNRNFENLTLIPLSGTLRLPTYYFYIVLTIPFSTMLSSIEKKLDKNK